MHVYIFPYTNKISREHLIMLCSNFIWNFLYLISLLIENAHSSFGWLEDRNALETILRKKREIEQNENRLLNSIKFFVELLKYPNISQKIAYLSDECIHFWNFWASEKMYSAKLWYSILHKYHVKTRCYLLTVPKKCIKKIFP